MAFLEVKNIKKVYTTRFGGNQVQALEDISFSVEKGEYIAIMGESGSGKTTLVKLLVGLYNPLKSNKNNCVPSAEIILDLYFRILTY